MRCWSDYVADSRRVWNAYWTPERIADKKAKELALARIHNRRFRIRKAGAAGKVLGYKPEPRGRDGIIPSYTRAVIQERRREYMDWWRPIVKRRLHQWKLEYWESMRRTVHRKLARRIRFRLKKFIDRPILTSTSQLVGCSLGELKAHIERQFRPGWTWENYGRRWNIDHITPLAKFDLSNPAHVKFSCHYTNLRPMAVWANSRKRDKIIRKAAQPFLPLPSGVLAAA